MKDFLRRYWGSVAVIGVIAAAFVIWGSIQLFQSAELTARERCEQGVSEDPCPEDNPKPPSAGDLGSEPGVPEMDLPPKVDADTRVALEAAGFEEWKENSPFPGLAGEWIHRFDHPDGGYEAWLEEGELQHISNGTSTIAVFCSHPDDDVEAIVNELPAALEAVQTGSSEGGRHEAANDVSCTVSHFE